MGNSTTASESNYGIYGVFGWLGKHGAMNLRVGSANKDVSVATRFAAVSWERPTRHGLLGVAVARTLLSSTFRAANLDDATDAEVFFRLPLASGAGHVTPSVQYVANPGFDASGITAKSSATVFGVRLHWSF